MDESRTQGRTEQYVGPSANADSQTCCRTGSASSGAGSGQRRPSVTAASRTGWRFGSGPTATASTMQVPHRRMLGKGVVITELEALVGLPIWTAYEPVTDAAV